MQISLQQRPLWLSFTQQNPYPLDWKLFLILIPITAAINHYLTYSENTLNTYWLITFTLDTLEGYVSWVAVRAFILWLDRVYPYERNFGKRVGIQLVGTFVIGLGLISLQTELVCWIARGHWVDMGFYLYALPIISIWFFGLNGIYVVYHYYNLTHEPEKPVGYEASETQGMRVSRGKKEIWLTWADIAGFGVEGEYVRVMDAQGISYLLDQSLSQLEKKLPASLFFRINRQYLLHRQLISGFERADGGKLKVLTQQPDFFGGEFSVSKKKAADFKRWFREK